jgi:hypothetical protein
MTILPTISLQRMAILRLAAAEAGSLGFNEKQSRGFNDLC